MKFLSTFFLVLILVCPRTYAFSVYESDKRKHVLASAAISMTSYGVMRHYDYDRWTSTWVAFTFTMLVGYAKELTDPFVDREDLQADAIGATAGIVIPLTFQF